MRRTLDLKFLAFLLAGTALFAVGLHFLHGCQVKRNAGVLLTRATKAAEEGDLTKAINYLSQYISFRPIDAESLLKLGNLLAENGVKTNSDKQLQRAYFVLNRVLLLDETNREARRKVVDLAMSRSIRRFADARTHLEELLKGAKGAKEKAELRFLVGVCHERELRYTEAAKEYEAAAKHDATMLKAFERAASLYRQNLDNPKDADRVMERMVRDNERSFEAYLSRVRYHMVFLGKNREEHLKKAAKDLEEAQKLAPTRAISVTLVAAELANALGEKVKARVILNQGLEHHPQEQSFYLSLADLEAKEGHVNEGLDVIRRGLKVISKKGHLLNKLVDLLVQDRKLAEAIEVIDQLRKEKYPEPFVAYHEARIHIDEGDWGTGGEKLARIRDQVLEFPALVRNIDFLLGFCYEKLGNPDQALLAYQQAVKFNPLDKDARLRVATAFLNLGRLDEALSEYRQIATFQDAPPAISLAMARLLMIRNLRLPEKARDWREVKEHLTAAARSLKDEVEVPILQADAILLEDPGRKDQARELLEKARTKHADRIEPWLALAALAVLPGLDKAEDALKVLDEAGRLPQFKETMELTLARMRFLAYLPKPGKALEELGKKVFQAEGDKRRRLLAGLGNAYYLSGDTTAARRIWKVQAQEKDQARNLGLRLLLFDLAMMAGQDEECLEWLTEIRKLEGETAVARRGDQAPVGSDGGKQRLRAGSYWRYGEASLIVARAKPKEGASPDPEAMRRLSKARQYLADAGQLRPSWHRVPALEAQIDDLEDRQERAIDNFQEALRLGDRRPFVIRRLVELLFARNRFEDAEKAIRTLIDQEQTLLSAGLGKLATQALLRTNDRDRALEIALKSVAKESRDYRDHLWLGQILQALNKNESAKKELARACELGPTKPEPWKALVLLLVTMEQKEEAKEVIARAVRALPDEQAPLTLAHCHAALGNVELAEKHFTAAHKTKPNDVLILENMATFYHRTGKAEQAEKCLKMIVGPDFKAEPEQVIRGRRNLALVLGLGMDFRRFNQAQELLATNLRVRPDSLPDLLARALIYSSRASERSKAIGIFEDLDRQQPLAAADRFTLANLYAASDNWPKAKFHMLTLLGSSQGKNAKYYGFYARRLLAREEVEAAEKWLAKLEEEFPSAPITLEIKARVLQAKGQDENAVRMLQALAQRKGSDPGLLARLADDLARTPKARPNYRQYAEELYRQKVAESPDQAAYLALADFLGRLNRLPEALDCCERALAKGPPEPVIALGSGILRFHEGGEKHAPRVEQWLQEKMKSTTRPMQLLQCLAELRDLQGQYGQAAELYEQILKKNPHNIVALNNLAWILAHQGRQGEALELMGTAIAEVGVLPELLDTRGVIFLLMDNKTAEALKDLQASVAMSGSPERHFHLARAYYLNQDLKRAREHLDKAKTTGLIANQLHPLERAQFQRLIDLLDRKKSGVDT